MSYVAIKEAILKRYTNSQVFIFKKLFQQYFTSNKNLLTKFTYYSKGLQKWILKSALKFSSNT